MTAPQHPDRIVLHVAGLDRPGVTARITQVIAEEKAELVNLGQSVLHGYLMLSAIVDIPAGSSALRRLLFAAAELGLRMEVSAFDDELPPQSPYPAPGLCVTMLGDLGDGGSTATITRYIAERGLNLREVRSLSMGRLTGLELITDPPGEGITKAALTQLRGELLEMGGKLGVDLAVQRDDIFRRGKRLVCMDVDSTFVKGEFIDELADLVGVKRLGVPATADNDGPAAVKGPGGLLYTKIGFAYPVEASLACTWNDALAETFGRSVGREARQVGPLSEPSVIPSSRPSESERPEAAQG